MSTDPIIKRVIKDPHVPLIPSFGFRWGTAAACITFVSAVIYAKWVEPRKVEERIKKEMFGPAAPSAH
jgi:hypothetical protein